MTEEQRQKTEKYLAVKISKLMLEEKQSWLVLTYKKPQESYPRARKDVFIFLRRIKKFYREQGIELKHILFTNRVGSAIYHQLLINQDINKKLCKLWNRGVAYKMRIPIEKGELYLATKALKNIEGHYVVSKNLSYLNEN